MKAKDMFEELGYKLDEDYMKETPDCIKYVLIKGSFGNSEFAVKRIYFWSDDKVLSFGEHDITLEEYKAIQKQIEELGWLD